MAPHKATGPRSFCEWVVGTTIDSALRTAPKKPRRRDIVRVEVSTDDESGEDSLKITYPRTAPAPQVTEPQAVVKKVRFEETPRKSALKKTTTTIVTSESEPETELETSDSAADVSSDEAVIGDASADSSDSSSKSSKSSKKSKKSRHVSESDEDSEPHPSCKCVECVRGRQKLKKQGKAAAKQKKEPETESSESEAEIPPKTKAPKTAKKASKAKPSPSETEEETSTSAPESEEEEEPVKKKVPQKSKAGGKKEQKKAKGENAQPAGKKQKKKVDDEEKEDSAEEEEKPVKAKKNKKNESKKAQPEPAIPPNKQNEAKKHNYPEGMPIPHPRRPHYIEPIRAEVVQTERVMETPQDPPPNAYYDAEHNIIRVYHGPVYGGNPNQALYPRRDPSMRPLPIGMPHPTKNPYHYGFNGQPPQDQPGLEHVPVTQGMPVNTWNAMCPPGIPPYQQGGPPGLYGPEPPMGKGAFGNMMTGANGGPPSSKDKDKAGANNVGPASVKVS